MNTKLCILLLLWSGSSPAAAQLQVEAVDSAVALDTAGIDVAALRARVAEAPGDRKARFDLIAGLRAGGDLAGALAAAREWRERDAYNLVVVRLIGDLQSELGQPEVARRTYSAVVELLPEDPDAHRALATVLKQAGDLEGALTRLEVAAGLGDTNDVRADFERADVAQRIGRADQAISTFEAISRSQASEDIRYPARQRLAQLYGEQRRAAQAAGDEARVAQLTRDIAALDLKGGAENDVKVYLSWDTDRTDVDLWVTNPKGYKVSYEHKEDGAGGALFHDVTSGYGPESYTAHQALAGTYTVQVNYYGTDRRRFGEARGEVAVVLNEGTAAESKQVFPYRLFEPRQTVTVARIHVGAGGAR